jgi:putative flavoprotein involved in K+ transport
VGNSGADIAMEVSRTHPAWISEKNRGIFRGPSKASWGVLLNPPGAIRRPPRAEREHSDRPEVAPRMLSRSAPLVRVKPRDLVSAGIERVPRCGECGTDGPAFGRSHTRCEECDLVHGIPSRLLVD